MSTTFDNLISAQGETVQIWGPSTGTDGLGNPENTWNTDKGTTTAVIQRPTSKDLEISSGRVTDTDKKMYALSDAAIATGNQIEIDSVYYDLLGALDDWQMKQAGDVQYLRMFLRRVK